MWLRIEAILRIEATTIVGKYRVVTAAKTIFLDFVILLRQNDIYRLGRTRNLKLKIWMRIIVMGYNSTG